MMRRVRWLNRVYAGLLGYFWAPCPICGEMFGGHETGGGGVATGEPGLYRLVCWRHDEVLT